MQTGVLTVGLWIDTFHTLVDDILQHSVQPEALDDGGLTRLFDSTANHRNSTPSLSSCLYKRPKSAAHGEREMVDTDRHFSRGESGTEGSDDEGPTIIRPSKKRAREVSRRHFLSPGSHSNRNGLSDSSLRGLFIKLSCYLFGLLLNIFNTSSFKRDEQCSRRNQARAI